jgi:radical SAM protein with 4Fe4S-binding SPASM domain
MTLIDNESYNIQEIETDPSWIGDLGDDYRDYRKRWDEAINGRIFNFPLFLEVETSYACNYRCPKCPRQAVGDATKSGFLSNPLLDKLFEEAKYYRMPSITFSHGGEPLMRKDIPELIRKARDSYILDRMFHTNGSLLNKALSEELIESGLTKINFSVDAASSDIYEKVRPGGEYKQIISNIHDFLDAKKRTNRSYPRVRVSFLISEENKHEQSKFYELWKDKVNVIAFQQCYDFKKLYKGFEMKEGFPDRYSCAQLWQLLTITHDGDILICEHDYNHGYVLGNLKTHTIHECWNSDTMNRFRKLHRENRWQELSMCRNCINCIEGGIGY